METENVFALFHRHFRLVLGADAGVVREAQRLRYQVYCLEHGFERPEDCAGGVEQDPYDSRSLHTLLQTNPEGAVAPETVGTVRMVLPDPEDASRSFPIEEHCGASFFPEFRRDLLPRETLGEISRFALSRHYRKRRGEPESPHGLAEDVSPLPPDDERRRVLPHLTIGLFRGIVRMSAQAGITHWYAVMELRLIRALHKFGIDFPIIGRAVEYHGERHPCMGAALDVLEGVYRSRPAVWEFITEGADLRRLRSF